MRPQAFHSTIFGSAAVLGFLIMLSFAGCDSSRRGLSVGTWPWGPSEVEIHALSRFLKHHDEELLSVRVEFRDQDGDPTKFPGTLVIEVDPEGLPDEEERTFSFDLSDLKVNAEYWDHVTLMYRFELRADWSEPPLPSTPIRVRVIATIQDQPSLTDGFTVRRGG